MKRAVGLGLIAAGIAAGAHGLMRLPATSQPDRSQSDGVLAEAFLMPTASLPSGVQEHPVGASFPAEAPQALPSRRASLAAEGLPRPDRSAMPAPGREGIARELQRALRRAGCYGGPINGAWTAGTKSAMKAFIERANATLPVDKPDIVLLALLENERGVSCASCPSGQLLRGGSCMPAAMARAERSAMRGEPQAASSRRREPDRGAAIVARSSTARSARNMPPLEGRMSIGGPKAASPPAGGYRQAAAPPSGRRHAGHPRYSAARSHGYGPLRPMRGIAELLFGGFRF